VNVEEQLREVFASSGCDGFLEASDIDSGAVVALEPEALVVSASVFKIAVALEFFRQADAGEIDPAARFRVRPQDGLGSPSGLALFSDEVEVSLRDLAVSMLTISDSIATDALLEHVGIDRVNELTGSLDLPSTVLVTGVMGMFELLSRDVGFTGWPEFSGQTWEDKAHVARVVELMKVATVCDPTHANSTRTTPHETARLLELIWRDEAAPAEACANVRRIMAKQLQRERIARAFKNDPDVAFAGKTGSFGGQWRNEAGVFTFPDGGRYAVAIFTRAHELYTRPMDIDDAIGEAARIAVDALRGAR
jgi:beta-lactamase class A